MLHQIAILALWSLLPQASGLYTRNATTTSPRTATFRATAIPTFFPTTVTFTSSFKSATGSTYRPPSPSKGVMSRHTNMAITSLLVQEWPHPENTLPFSQSIYILATTVETVTVRYYPHGTTKPPHPSSSIYITTEATSSPRSMQVFPFSLTKFPTTRTTTFTTSTSGTTFITPGPGTGDAPLPTTPPIITIKTIVTRIETITEAWASKPTPLPYTLTRTAKARVTQSQYYLAPNGHTTSSGVAYWNEHYFPNMVVYAL